MGGTGGTLWGRPGALLGASQGPLPHSNLEYNQKHNILLHCGVIVREMCFGRRGKGRFCPGGGGTYRAPQGEVYIGIYPAGAPFRSASAARGAWRSRELQRGRSFVAGGYSFLLNTILGLF
jgi:hypothetical protein